MNYLSNGNPKIHGEFTARDKSVELRLFVPVVGWEMMSGHPIFLVPREGLRSLGEMLARMETLISKDGAVTFDGYSEREGFFTTDLQNTDLPESADEKFKRRGF